MTWQADTLKVQAGAAVGRELRTLLKPLVKPGGSSTHRADRRSGRFSLYVRSRGFLSRAWNHRTMAGGLVGCLTLLSWEPVSGFEPLTCRLQEVRPYATCTLAALMAQVIALMALVGLELPGAPVHEPVHEWPPGDIHSRNSV